jgi:hypothetical protein
LWGRFDERTGNVFGVICAYYHHISRKGENRI